MWLMIITVTYSCAQPADTSTYQTHQGLHKSALDQSFGDVIPR